MKSALLILCLCLPMLVNAETGDLLARVARISADYGNIDTELMDTQLDQFQLKQGDRFNISLGDHKISVYFGTNYADVERGEWVGIITEFGNLRLARNFENAASTIGAKLGDEILITR